MSMHLLTTKLYIPPARPDLVSRPRLMERLTAGLERRLTLVSAPAGFGKTTLLSEWTANADLPVAWVSLDEGDNDQTRFWSYVIAALQTVHADVGGSALAALRSPQPPPMEALLTGLINEVAETAGRFVLVLDDYHLIETPLIHDALVFLLEHVPPQMRLVIATRIDPPLPLQRLRGRGQLSELRQADLRFRPDETAAFLNQAMSLELAEEDVASLEMRTEGWIVGLQLAALSLQEHPDKHGFVTVLAGDDRYIADYLVEEVLGRQPPQVQAFLLQTSILERLNAALCDAVVGQPDSQATLDQLERANLFLVPLDNRREWYRYHHLFADLLRRHLVRSTETRERVALHQRASEWYEREGLIPEAVRHALAAEDIQRVATLIADNALAMVYHGELMTLMSWLGAIPEERVRAQPWLCVAKAWALAYSGDLDAVEPVLRYAERGLTALAEPAQARYIAGHVTAIRAYVADLNGELGRAIDLAREALEHLDEQDLMVRGFTWSMLGTTLRGRGALGAAVETSAEAVAISRATGDYRVIVTALCELATSQSWQGKLRDAAATCQAALETAGRFAERSGQQLPVAGLVYARLADVLCEWNELEAALRCARQAVALCERWGQPDTLAIAYAALARALRSVGDAKGAADAMHKAQQVANDLSSWYGDYMSALEARNSLLMGDADAAIRWARTCGLSVDDGFVLDTESEYRTLIEYRTLARVLMAQGRWDETHRLLAWLVRAADAAGTIYLMIEILVLQALAWQAQADLGKALAALERALTIAEPEGYVRTFVDVGAPMAELLRQAAARGIAVGYVRRLLDALGRDGNLESVLPEPLTSREMEVLRLIAVGASNPQIAEQLVITVNTVKKHVTHIYGKLAVSSRTQAVARARELGMLD